ncbi:unnamed protein product, partial [Prorocentrum cordatum]
MYYLVRMVFLHLGASRPWNILLLMLLFLTVALVTQNIIPLVMTLSVSLFSTALAVYVLILAYPLELLVMYFLDPFTAVQMVYAGLGPSRPWNVMLLILLFLSVGAFLVIVILITFAFLAATVLPVFLGCRRARLLRKPGWSLLRPRWGRRLVRLSSLLLPTQQLPPSRFPGRWRSSEGVPS